MKIKNFNKTASTITIIITIVFTTALITSSGPVKSLPANSMWIEPSVLEFETTTTPVGYRFSITIYTNLSVPSYAWQIYLTYNKNHLNATGCWYTAGSKSQWAGTNPTTPLKPSYGSHNETLNYVLFGESLQGEVETPPGTYTLAIVQFEITASPPLGQILQSQIRLDIKTATRKSRILDPDLKEIPLSFGGATYTYTSPEVPPPPVGAKIFIDPPEIIDPTLLPPAAFTVNVSIDDVLNLYGYEFNLSFDKNVLTCLYLIINDVQGETNYIPEIQINNPKGFLWVKVTYYPPAKPITTTTPLALATITFRVKSIGASILDLHDTALTDNQGSPIEHEAKDGFIMTLIRDIAVTNVTLSRSWAYAGWPINVSITVKNLGYITENFTVTAYYDNNLIGTKDVFNLPSGEEETVIITWDTTGLSQGIYTISAKLPILPYETNTANNNYVNGKVTIFTEIKDIAIINVTTPRNWAYHGSVINISVTVKNLGVEAATFNVTAYYNETAINTITVTTLPPSSEAILTFSWNTSVTTPCNVFNIWAEASQIPYEYDITNNRYVDGTVKIRLVGDVDGDGIVDVKDLAMVSKAYGSTPDMPRWNEYADINQDELIDLTDVALIAKNFGTSCQ